MKSLIVAGIAGATVLGLAPTQALAQANGNWVTTPGSAVTGFRGSAPRSNTTDSVRHDLLRLSSSALSQANMDRYEVLWQQRDADGIATFLVTEANKGNVWAMREAGAFYGGENGLANHPAKSLYWYHEAAVLGDQRSALVVGTAYARGLIVEQDSEMARFWLKKAREGKSRKTRLDAKKLLASL